VLALERSVGNALSLELVDNRRMDPSPTAGVGNGLLDVDDFLCINSIPPNLFFLMLRLFNFRALLLRATLCEVLRIDLPRRFVPTRPASLRDLALRARVRTTFAVEFFEFIF